jgi:hypothetical protein
MIMLPFGSKYLKFRENRAALSRIPAVGRFSDACRARFGTEEQNVAGTSKNTREIGPFKAKHQVSLHLPPRIAICNAKAGSPVAMLQSSPPSKPPTAKLLAFSEMERVTMANYLSPALQTRFLEESSLLRLL